MGMVDDSDLVGVSQTRAELLQMPQPEPEKAAPPLSTARSDIERKLSLPAGRYTQPGPVLPIIGAALLTIAFFALLIPLGDTWFARSFTERGWVPYAIVGFSAWALMMIIIKNGKVSLQQRATAHHVVPDAPEFVISTATVEDVLDRFYQVAEDPKEFLLYNRIQLALSNLKNIGRVGDVDEILRSRAETDDAMSESSYVIIRGLVWAIPVLGFIGTVLGLTAAMGSFGAVLESANEMADLKISLQSVTAGLATAFETTLQALCAALGIHLLMTFVHRREQRMLDAMIDYCDRQIVARLRLTQPGVEHSQEFEDEPEA